MLRSREARGVAAAAPDRIWRSPEEYGKFRKTVKRRSQSTGIRVLAGGHDFNLSNPGDHLLLAFLTNVAAHEVEQTQKRERDALEALALAAVKHGIASFGYLAVHLEPGDDPDGIRKMHEPARSESGACPGCEGRKPARWRSQVLEPREAEALYDAGRRYWTCVNCDKPVLEPNPDCSGTEEDGRDRHRGASLGSLLGVLDDEWKTPTKTGLPWRLSGSSTLAQVLRNPVNLGLRVHVPVAGGSARRAAWDDPEAASRWKVGWPAIFTAAERDALVTLLDRNKKGRGNWNTRPSHMLTGLVWCGICGGKMFRMGDEYRCTARGPQQAGCVVRKASEVEAEAELRILRWMRNDGLYGKAQAAADDEGVQQMRKDRDKAQEDLDAMTRAGAIARWSDDKLAAELAPYHAEIARLTRLIGAAQNYDEMADVYGEIEKLQESRKPGKLSRDEAFRELWDGWDPNRQREIATRLIARIVIHKAPWGVRPADRRFIQIWPAAWAASLADPAQAAPPPVPDAGALRPRARVLAWLAEYGQLASPAEVAAGCGMTLENARRVLYVMGREGSLERVRCPRGTAMARAATDAEREALIAAETARRGAKAFGGMSCWGYRLPPAAS